MLFLVMVQGRWTVVSGDTGREDCSPWWYGGCALFFVMVQEGWTVLSGVTWRVNCSQWWYRERGLCCIVVLGRWDVLSDSNNGENGLFMVVVWGHCTILNDGTRKVIFFSVVANAVEMWLCQVRIWFELQLGGLCFLVRTLQVII